MAVKNGKIVRPHVGRCPICGVHTHEACKSWCNAYDPHENKDLKKNR